MKGKPAYAIPAGSVIHPGAHAAVCGVHLLDLVVRRHRIGPDDTITYTNNWPHEPLVGNRPTGESRRVDRRQHHHAAGRHLRDGLVVRARRSRSEPDGAVPTTDPLGSWAATPSQRATVKYFWVVSALILVQILLGVITAHYGVEGDGFYGIPALQVAALQRDAHLARAARHLLDRHGLAGRRPVHRPAGQRHGTASARRSASTSCSAPCCSIVVGSLTGEWLSIQNKLSDADVVLWGHQGYEYVDLGRVWQIAAVRRTADLAVPGGPRHAPGAARSRRTDATCCGSSCCPPAPSASSTAPA